MALEILKHRHLVAHGPSRGRQSPRDHRLVYLNAEGIAYRLCFMHAVDAQSAQARRIGDTIECRQRKSANRIEADIAPQFEPNAIANILSDRRIEIRCAHDFAESLYPLRFRSIGLTQNEPIELVMFYHSRLDDLASWIDDATNCPLWSDRLPLKSLRIHGPQVRSFERAAFLVEIPPRNAVHRGDDRCIGS